jgi:hypothetical protein
MAAVGSRQRRRGEWVQDEVNDPGLHEHFDKTKESLILEAEQLIEHIRGRSAGTHINSNDHRTDEGTWGAAFDLKDCSELSGGFHDSLPSPRQAHARMNLQNVSISGGGDFEGRDPYLERASGSRHRPGMKHASDDGEVLFSTWLHGGGSSRNDYCLEVEDDESSLMGVLNRSSSQATVHHRSPFDYDDRQSDGVHSRWQALYARDAVRRLVHPQ